LWGGSLWANTAHGLQSPYFPHTGIGISGYAWLDNGYEKIDRGDPTQADIKFWLQQGRFVFRATPTYTSGRWFAQAQAELVATKEQPAGRLGFADVDDLWVRTGYWGSWDITVGRFEAWEVYHLGMGLDINTIERNGATDSTLSAPSIYGVTFAYYR